MGAIFSVTLVVSGSIPKRSFILSGNLSLRVLSRPPVDGWGEFLSVDELLKFYGQWKYIFIFYPKQ